jgi:hypothetical protein
MLDRPVALLLCQQGAAAHLTQLVISVTSAEGAAATFSLYVSVAAAAVVLVATPSTLQVGPNVSGFICKLSACLPACLLWKEG